MSVLTADAALDNPWLAHRVWIDKITLEAPGVSTFHFRFADAQRHASYRFRPGQFNMLYLPGSGETPISVSAGAHHNGTWDHTIRSVGNVTRTLFRMTPGSSIGLRGPYGSCWPVEKCIGADVVIVAGGIGLPPLRPVIYELLSSRKRHGQLHLLYGARTPDALLYSDEYSGWSDRGLNIQLTVDRSPPNWLGNVGTVPLLLDRLRTLSSGNTIVLACGPEVMLRYTVQSAMAHGIASDRIWVSLERNMQCAVGFCGHCQLGPAFICKDGPVFRYDLIAPFLAIEGL